VSDPFAVSLERAGDSLLVKVAGDLDLSTAGHLARVIECECPRDAALVIDLSEVAFLDCAGLRVLLVAKRRADRGGGTLRLIPGPAPVQRIIRLARLDTRLEPVGQREYSASNSAA
jgi:anti-sigma B factor antagonist